MQYILYNSSFLLTVLLTLALCLFPTRNHEHVKSLDIAAQKTAIGKANLHNMDSEEYERFTYEEYLEATENLVRNQMLVKRSILEDLYPNLQRNECLDGVPCKTIMYEVANKALGQHRIEKMPTILLIGGMNGSEATGMRTILAFVETVQKLYTIHRDWYNVANSVRILAIPVLNVSGFSEMVDYETRQVGGKNVDVYPETDFNLETNKDCFESLSTQFLSLLYKDNLIYASLNLSGTDFRIDYPQLEPYLSSYRPIPEEKIYKEVAVELSKFYNRHKPDEAPSMPVEKFKPVKRLDTENGALYEEWASSSSKYSAFSSSNCIHKNDPFFKQYKKPTEISHRSFAIRIGINLIIKDGQSDNNETKEKKTDKDFKYLNYPLGNEMYVFRSEEEGSKKGIVSVGILMINQFVKYMVPLSPLRAIDWYKGAESEKPRTELDLSINVRGCLSIGEAQLNSPQPSEQGIAKKQLIQKENDITEVTYKVVFEGDKALDENKSYTFDLNLECNSHFLKYEEDPRKFMTHFARSQTNPNYAPANYKYEIKNTQMSGIKVRNIVLSKLNDAIIYTKIPKDTKIFYGKSFLIQVGTYFPIELLYEKQTGKLDFKILENEIPESVRSFERPNYSLNQGMLSWMEDSTKNLRLNNQLNFLKTKQIKAARIMVYTSNLQAITTNLNTVAIQTMNSWNEEEHKHSHGGSFDEMHNHGHSKSFHVHDSTQSPEQIRKHHEKLLSKKLEPYVDRTLFFLEENPLAKEVLSMDNGLSLRAKEETDEIHESDFYSIVNLYTSIIKDGNATIIPSAFIDIIGRQITLEFSFEVDENSNDYLGKSKKNVFALAVKQMKKEMVLKINGNIIVHDKAITKTIETNQKEDFPLTKDLKLLEPNENTLLATSGVYCSSLFPYVRIETSDMVAKAILNPKPTANDKRNKYFYFLSVLPKSSDQSKAEVSLFTDNPNKPDALYMYNKKLKYRLDKTGKLLNLEGDLGYYSNKITIYSATFSIEEVSLAGNFFFIIPHGKTDSWFECFTSKINTNLSPKKLLENYIISNLEVTLIKKIHANYLYEKTWGFYFISLLTNKIFIGSAILVVLLIFIVIVGLSGKSKKKKEIEQPMKDEEEGGQVKENKE